MRAGAAIIYELDDDGVRQLSYDDVTAVGLWRRFLDKPDRLLQILYRDDDPDDAA
jgi:predicted ATPase